MNYGVRLLPIALVFAGCGSTAFTSAGPARTPREATCDFQVFTSSVPENVEEIGTIDVTNGAYGSHTYRELADFKEEIRPYVCRAGGDAVLAQANGLGMWIKASVLIFGAPTSGDSSRAAASECSPPCSPGYQCSSGTCIALCNPACPSGWLCGPDRTCHGAGDSTQSSASAP